MTTPQGEHTVITDEMLDRAERAYVGRAGESGLLRDRLARALDVALNPRVEPEIPVSRNMLAAGIAAWGNFRYDGARLGDELTSIYRAMELQRRKELPKHLPSSPASNPGSGYYCTCGRGLGW